MSHSPIGGVHSIFHHSRKLPFTGPRVIALQRIRSGILSTYDISVVRPQHHKRLLQWLRNRRIGWSQSQLNQLRFQHCFSERSLHHIRTIQAIHAVHTENGLLLTNGTLRVVPIEAHRSGFGGNRFDERRHVLEAHTSTIVVKVESHVDQMVTVETNNVVAERVEYDFLFASLFDEIHHVDGTIGAQFTVEVFLEGQLRVGWI